MSSSVVKAGAGAKVEVTVDLCVDVVDRIAGYTLVPAETGIGAVFGGLIPMAAAAAAQGGELTVNFGCTATGIGAEDVGCVVGLATCVPRGIGGTDPRFNKVGTTTRGAGSTTTVCGSDGGGNFSLPAAAEKRKPPF